MSKAGKQYMNAALTGMPHPQDRSTLVPLRLTICILSAVDAFPWHLELWAAEVFKEASGGR